MPELKCTFETSNEQTSRSDSRADQHLSQRTAPGTDCAVDPGRYIPRVTQIPDIPGSLPQLVETSGVMIYFHQRSPTPQMSSTMKSTEDSKETESEEKDNEWTPDPSRRLRGTRTVRRRRNGVEVSTTQEYHNF